MIGATRARPLEYGIPEPDNNTDPAAGVNWGGKQVVSPEDHRRSR